MLSEILCPFYVVTIIYVFSPMVSSASDRFSSYRGLFRLASMSQVLDNSSIQNKENKATIPQLIELP